jgi:hypothetical protein
LKVLIVAHIPGYDDQAVHSSDRCDLADYERRRQPGPEQPTALGGVPLCGGFIIRKDRGYTADDMVDVPLQLAPSRRVRHSVDAEEELLQDRCCQRDLRAMDADASLGLAIRMWRCHISLCIRIDEVAWHSHWRSGPGERSRTSAQTSLVSPSTSQSAVLRHSCEVPPIDSVFPRLDGRTPPPREGPPHACHAA